MGHKTAMSRTLLSTANPARPLDPRIQRSRQALHAALLELLEQQPFDQITVTGLTQRAKVGYTTFFRHYQTKDELLDDVAAKEIRDLLALSVPLVLQVGSLESCRALCSHVDRRRAIWKALLTGGAGGSVRSEFLRQARGCIPPGWVSQGPVPVDVATLYSAAGTLEVLSWWLNADESVPVEEIAAMLDRLIMIPKG